jgi:uncharacterized Fe-S cluster-containing protein
MERKGIYMDFLFSSKDEFKKSLIERINKIKDTIKKVEEKYGNNNKVLIKDSAIIDLKETLILALSYLAMLNSDKVKEYKDKVIEKLAYIKENRILTLDQYKDAYLLLKQILAE